MWILNKIVPTHRKKIGPWLPVPIAHAGALAIVLLIVGLGIIFQLSIDTFYVSLSYVVIMIAYCRVFRKIALVDIGIIATGFVIRLYVGSTVRGIPIII
jgi:decaprenyl-phosphate phosphoribosyltransferase